MRAKDISRLYSEHLPRAAENAVISHVESAVRADHHSARRKERALGYLRSRAVRSDTDQSAGPVVEDKGIQQTVLGDLQNVQRTVPIEGHVYDRRESLSVNLGCSAIRRYAIDARAADRKWKTRELADVVMPVRSERDRGRNHIHRDQCPWRKLKEGRRFGHPVGENRQRPYRAVRGYFIESIGASVREHLFAGQSKDTVRIGVHLIARRV